MCVVVVMLCVWVSLQAINLSKCELIETLLRVSDRLVASHKVCLLYFLIPE